MRSSIFQNNAQSHLESRQQSDYAFDTDVKTLAKSLSKNPLFKGIKVKFKHKISCTEGSARFDKDVIQIGSSEWKNQSDLSENMIVVSTLVSMFHEQMHIMQNRDVVNGKATDDIVLSHLVDSNNNFYYLFNYKRVPRELDAEFSGVNMTYRYMVRTLKIEDDVAFSMIKEYVEFKKDHSNFYDGVNYKSAKSMKELEDMFDAKYESAQRDHDPYGEIYRKPEKIYVRTGLFKKEPKDVIRHIPNTDMAFKYINEHPDIKALFGTFDGVKGIRNRNKIMAAITLELKPKLRRKYKDYECVRNLHLDEVCYELALDKFKKPEPRNVSKSAETNLRSSEFNYIAMNNNHVRSKDDFGIV